MKIWILFGGVGCAIIIIAPIIAIISAMVGAKLPDIFWWLFSMIGVSVLGLSILGD